MGRAACRPARGHGADPVLRHGLCDPLGRPHARRVQHLVGASDVWGTYLDSVALVHGHLSSGYAAYPGILVALAPIAAIGSALHLEVGPTSRPSRPDGLGAARALHLAHRLAASLAADAVAERWGVPRSRRFALSIAEAVLLANVTVKWGHPRTRSPSAGPLAPSPRRRARAARGVAPRCGHRGPSRWHCWRCQHCSRGGVRWGARALGATSLRAVAPAPRSCSRPSHSIGPSSAIGSPISPTTSGSTIRRRGPRSPTTRLRGFLGRCRRSSRVVASPWRWCELVLCRRTTTLQRVVLALAVAFAARVASEAVLDAYTPGPS